jgi:hypothetical protein
MAALEAGDVFLVTRLDRLAHSTRDLLNVLDEVAKKSVGFQCEGTNPAECSGYPVPLVPLLPNRSRDRADRRPTARQPRMTVVSSCLLPDTGTRETIQTASDRAPPKT